MAGGTGLSANDASKKRKEFAKQAEMGIPDLDAETSRYFEDLLGRMPQANELADKVGESDLDRTLRLREKAAPGIGNLTRTAMDSITPLLKGELPPGVLAAFKSAGGASTAGLGMGGSGFGFLNTGLYGARGSLGAMQTGFGLLPALMGTLPNINSPSSSAFLQAIMTPAQRVQTQLNIRSQNIGIASTLAGMETSQGMIGGGMQEIGGLLLGGAMGGMGMPSMGGGGAGYMSAAGSAGGYAGMMGGPTGMVLGNSLFQQNTGRYN